MQGKSSSRYFFLKKIKKINADALHLKGLCLKIGFLSLQRQLRGKSA